MPQRGYLRGIFWNEGRRIGEGSSAALQEAQVPGSACRLHAIVDLKFAIDTLKMLSDSTYGDDQGLCDLFVGEAGGKKP